MLRNGKVTLVLLRGRSGRIIISERAIWPAVSENVYGFPIGTTNLQGLQMVKRVIKINTKITVKTKGRLVSFNLVTENTI